MNTPHYYGSIGVMNARHLHRRDGIVRSMARSLRVVVRQVFRWLDAYRDARRITQAGAAIRLHPLFAPRGEVSRRLDRPLGVG